MDIGIPGTPLWEDAAGDRRKRSILQARPEAGRQTETQTGARSGNHFSGSLEDQSLARSPHVSASYVHFSNVRSTSTRVQDPGSDRTSRSGGDLDVLHAIHEKPVNLAVVMRRLPGVLTRWLDHLPLERFPRLRARVGVEQTSETIQDLIGRSDLPLCPERDLLADDICGLVRRFARLFQCHGVDLRMDCHDGVHGACTEFHEDFTTFRLLTAYRGAGLQWLPEALAGMCGPDGRSLQEESVETVPRYGVAVFKGKAAPGRPLLHRAPPVPDARAGRFVLCLTVPR